MPYVNRVIQMGHMTRDAELKSLESGTKVCEFALAVTRSWKVEDEWKEKTSFFECVAWGYKAEAAAKLEKGDLVLVEGRLEQDRWETPEGDKRSKIRIQCDAVKFIRKPNRQGGEEAPPEGVDSNGVPF